MRHLHTSILSGYAQTTILSQLLEISNNNTSSPERRVKKKVTPSSAFFSSAV
ncbi:hypothetical protein CGMCC3_g570 [Colletotrichum fructicola]|nr:uncharacterized protein CGMCC3_g570 [Colletotrichum fructicola]KAE9583487.1 hypothetical protein CGMCC3_g570 [Colletotrichum fructicola]